MSISYALMAAGLLTVETTGRTESVVRFLGYTVSWSVVCFVLGAIVDADRRTTLALIGPVLAAPWATLASWVFDGTIAAVASLVLLVSLGGMVYLLVGPLSSVAETVSGERALLYTKVKRLILLVFTGLILTGAVSEQNLGLTGAFVGQTVATYVDLIWLAGFGALVLQYADTLEAEEVPSPFSKVTRGGTHGQPD